MHACTLASTPAPHHTKSYHALDRAVVQETPDLVVFSGDMLTGLNVDSNATAYWDRLVNIMDRYRNCNRNCNP